MIEGFSSFGAPLLEGFDTVNANDTNCFEYRNERFCKVNENEGDNVPTTSVVEEPSEEPSEEEVEEEVEEEEEEQEEDPNTQEMQDADTEEALALADTEEPEEDAEEDAEEVDQEAFTNRNVVEGFSGNVSIRQLMNLNLLLKSILFGCLFYILAHPNTRSFVAKNIFKKLKKSQYLYVAMVLFIVVYYVLNLVV